MKYRKDLQFHVHRITRRETAELRETKEAPYSRKQRTWSTNFLQQVLCVDAMVE